MENEIFRLHTDLTTMDEVMKFESLLIEMELDTIDRPLHWARHTPHPSSNDPLASVYVYTDNRMRFWISSAYRSSGFDDKFKVTPEQMYNILMIIKNA